MFSTSDQNITKNKGGKPDRAWIPPCGQVTVCAYITAYSSRTNPYRDVLMSESVCAIDACQCACVFWGRKILFAEENLTASQFFPNQPRAVLRGSRRVSCVYGGFGFGFVLTERNGTFRPPNLVLESIDWSAVSLSCGLCELFANTEEKFPFS